MESCSPVRIAFLLVILFALACGKGELASEGIRVELSLPGVLTRDPERVKRFEARVQSIQVAVSVKSEVLCQGDWIFPIPKGVQLEGCSLSKKAGGQVKGGRVSARLRDSQGRVVAQGSVAFSSEGVRSGVTWVVPLRLRVSVAEFDP